MAVDFVEVMKKIIGIDELKDFSKVEERLFELGEGFVFQDNKPTHVIMTLEYYEQMKNGHDNSKGSAVQTDGLEVLLNKIGKKIFIDYYESFKLDNDPESALEAEGFTLASRRSRSSSARAIFRNNLQIAALENIANSDRVDVDTIERAKILLEYENNGVIVEESTENNEDSYHIKIGKMMKGILTKLIQNGMLSDEELLKLQNPEYSKQIMNLNFPVLKSLLDGQSSDEAKKDAKGYNRYYDAIVQYKNCRYLICSQWVDNLHRESVVEWIRKKMIDILVSVAMTIPTGNEFEVRDMVPDYWPYIDHTTRNSIGRSFKKIVLEHDIANLGGKRGNRQIYIKK